MATTQITGLNPIGVVNDSDLILIHSGVEDFKGTVTDLKNNLNNTYLKITDNLTTVQDKPAAFNAIKQYATTTSSGVLEIADNTETITGTDTSRAVVPSGLKAKLADIDIIAGTGLVNGGNLGGDVTLNMGTPSTITGTSTNSVTADSHTHAINFSDSDLNIHGLTVGCKSNPSNGNSILGFSGLMNNTTGTSNTAIGMYSLSNNTTGSGNTAVGREGLYSNTTGYNNTAVGDQSLELNTTGYNNTAVGSDSLWANTTGTDNVAVGRDGLYNNTTGYNNTAVGAGSLMINSSGINNTAIGFTTLDNNTGDNNTAIGSGSLGNSTSGSNNIAIGTGSGTAVSPFNVTTHSDRVVIGNNTITNAYIKVSWTVTSDKRDKTDIQQLGKGLDFVNRLNPVSYQFREGGRDSDKGDGITRYGFLAQDILVLEGDNPVLIDNEQPELLKLKESNLTAILVKAIQELTCEVNKLKTELLSK